MGMGPMAAAYLAAEARGAGAVPFSVDAAG
jgi:hypothetical protein